jgi:hypothetical protein
MLNGWKLYFKGGMLNRNAIIGRNIEEGWTLRIVAELLMYTIKELYAN